MRDLRLKNYEEDFLRLSNKILNVFATEDKIFNLSPEKLHFLIDCKKKYVLINSDKHAYPFLQPKETALIIKNYLKTLKNEEFEKKISRSFDRGSKFYEFNSDIQKNICLELINFYKNLKINRDRMKFENALDIGCGSGFMTNQINRLENFSKIHLIDISKKMISKAKQNLSNEKFSFEVADFDNFKCYGIYDLVFSNMSLHWSGNFTKLFFNLLNQIPCGGSFIFSIPNSIKFDFESSEISKDFFEKLINMLPDSDDLNRMIDKDKFYFFSSKKKFLVKNLKTT